MIFPVFRYTHTPALRIADGVGLTFVVSRRAPSLPLLLILLILFFYFCSSRGAIRCVFQCFPDRALISLFFFDSKDVSFLVFNCFQFYLNIHARSKVRNSVLDLFFCFARVFFFGRLEADFSSFEGFWRCGGGWNNRG